MKDQKVYYCWFCDAHRLAMGAQQPRCPRCGHELPADAHLDSPLSLSGAGKQKRPADGRALVNRAM